MLQKKTVRYSFKINYASYNCTHCSWAFTAKNICFRSKKFKHKLEKSLTLCSLVTLLWPLAADPESENRPILMKSWDSNLTSLLEKEIV